MTLPSDEARPAASVAPDEDGDEPTRVVAQGTFDLLHPGHVHYLEEAAAMGDELHVIVARAATITHKPDPVLPNAQRRDTVAALEAVDHARLGHPEDFSVPIEAIDPDVLVLGYDQHHDEADVAAMLAEWGIDCRVERASPLESEAEGDAILSSSEIKARVLERRAVELSRIGRTVQ